MSINPYIQKAVDICDGSQTELARRCCVKQQHVWKWLRMQSVPADRCPDIEYATAGKVTCEELRPDVKWWVLRGTEKVAS
jgi:DNA-binding transcriptional regulator YdaS (Cro superfamily)